MNKEMDHGGRPKPTGDKSTNSRNTTNFKDTTEGSTFVPVDFQNHNDPPPLIASNLPTEIWTIIHSTPANFPPQYFLSVSRNLLENPNITASHLSRAELSYTSFTDASYNPEARHPHELAGVVKHLKPEHQPLLLDGGVPGYKLEWTVVRKLIPRNPKVDEAVLQTCHLFVSTQDATVKEKNGEEQKIQTERYLVVYIPHVSDPDSMPFYHPKVRGLAIMYAFQKSPPTGSAPGALSIYYNLFPQQPLDNRMSRTALKMIEIIHKHARGRMAGYQKRVHHDVVIAQKPFQDTYAYLKGKYAKELIDNWVEQTPAQKHVFEDLGIAAFLIELWTEMYGGEAGGANGDAVNTAIKDLENRIGDLEIERKAKAKKSFPGFVDIGCGNGLLVYILNLEGWNGWGFDARRRKTWDTFGEAYASKLKAMLLVPSVLKSDSGAEEDDSIKDAPTTHNGIFPPGTFIVSNHADELTPWTPLLAFLSESPFIAIPCCSHNFGGTRYRAPFHPQYSPTPPASSNNSKQASAYAALCSYVSHLTASLSYVPEKEHLRIPSTRNIAIIGRQRREEGEGEGERKETWEERRGVVKEILEREMSRDGNGETSVEQIGLMWMRRGSGLLKAGKGAGH